MFWSSKTLSERLPELITEYDPERLGRSNYSLSIGPEVFVSPTRKPEGATDHTKIRLDPRQHFRIPAGQFAFLLTEEHIKVPADALAFISIRATYKFRGLVNVSGFHVDPNFDGRLLFAVFNAGPSAIALERGEVCFHIWYASVDHPSDEKPRVGYEHIPADLIDKLGEELMSFDGLSSKISDVEKRLVERISTIERDHSVQKWIFGVLLGVVITVTVLIFRQPILDLVSFFGSAPSEQSIVQQSESEVSGAPQTDRDSQDQQAQ